MKYITKENIVLILIMFIALKLTDFNQTMSSMWVGPYLSAAVNFDWSSLSFSVNMQDIKEFASLSKSQMFGYHFSRTDDLMSYDYLANGLVIALMFAKKLFFWVGDLEALQYLQYVVHIILSLVILNLFEKKYQQILFFIFYAINPIILYFVNYPYYYFWQVIPSAIFVYWLYKKDIKLPLMVLFSVIFSYIYITRPTVLFLVILFYIVYALRDDLKKALVGFGVFMFLINIAPSLSIGPWHTMYVGIGAYPNKYNIKLDDEDGYKFYKQTTGKVVNSGNVMVEEIKQDYYAHLKQRLLEIAKESPFMLIKHALFNVAESYSIGYKVGNNFNINYVSIGIGILMMLLLLYTKQYILFLAIGFAGGSFTPYFPPIGAYMYGSYILIVVGFIGIIEYFLSEKATRINYENKNIKPNLG